MSTDAAAPEAEPMAEDGAPADPAAEADEAAESDEAAAAVDPRAGSSRGVPLAELVPRHPLVPVFCIGLPILGVGVYGLEVKALIAAIASVALTLLAAIDIEHRVLPDRIIFPTAAVVLALQLGFYGDDQVEWLLAGPAAAAFFALPLMIRRDAMGLGDIKLALLLGTIVGWDVFGAIVVGCLSIVPIALWMKVTQGSIKGATLPFGPFLAFGTLVILFTS